MSNSREDRALLYRIKELRDRFTNIDNHISFDYSGRVRNFVTPVEEGLYQIIGQFLDNKVDHQDASRVSLQLIENKTRSVLVLMESGFNGDEESVKKISWLMNIARTVQSLNGAMAVEVVGKRIAILIDIPDGRNTKRYNSKFVPYQLRFTISNNYNTIKNQF